PVMAANQAYPTGTGGSLARGVVDVYGGGGRIDGTDVGLFGAAGRANLPAAMWNAQIDVQGVQMNDDPGPGNTDVASYLHFYARNAMGAVGFYAGYDHTQNFGQFGLTSGGVEAQFNTAALTFYGQGSLGLLHPIEPAFVDNMKQGMVRGEVRLFL